MHREDVVGIVSNERRPEERLRCFVSSLSCPTVAMRLVSAKQEESCKTVAAEVLCGENSEWRHRSKEEVDVRAPARVFGELRCANEKYTV